jgi:signal transduction histidine kinase/HPt (histidine-containing phosphotransfer) domain-containing protein
MKTTDNTFSETFSALFALSLTVSATPEPRDACRDFLGALINRFCLAGASIWWRATDIEGEGADGLMLLNAAPRSPDGDCRLPFSHPLWQRTRPGLTVMTTFGALASPVLDDMDIAADCACALFPLGEQGILLMIASLGCLADDCGSAEFDALLAKLTRDIQSSIAYKQAGDALAMMAKRSGVLLALPGAAEGLGESGFMQYALTQAEDLTGSQMAFLRVVNEDEAEIELNICSPRTFALCNVVFNPHIVLKDGGMWADAWRRRQPSIINDYASSPHQSGLPQGHIPVSRMICVPVIEGDKVVMLIGLGNKPVCFTERDIETVQLIGNEVWRIVQHKRSLDALRWHRDELEQQVAARTLALSDALEAARRADESKNAFLANISHELRTPLNAVVGMAGLASSLGTNPKQRDYLDKIVASGKHLNRIINDLLDLTKITAGRLDIDHRTFSVRELISRGHSLLAHRAETKGLALHATIDADVPDVLVGDPYRIEQILLNLLSNAIKFTERGGIDIRVHAGAPVDGKVDLIIEVEDSGIGIGAEDLQHLFQPFSQLDTTLNRKYEGTGLGLAISRRLAQMMNGDIRVSSREGKGSVFVLEIGLALGCKDNLFPVAETAVHAPAGHVEQASILVVEDQPLNREIVEALLRSVGIVPLIVENGKEALDVLLRIGPDGFDLVLMDIQMPVMDGLSATRELKRHPEFASLPVIGMTAHTMEHEKKIGTEAGMVDHIGKPFDNATFLKTVEKWIFYGKGRQLTVSDADVPAAPIMDVPPPPSDSDALNGINGLDVSNALSRFNGKMDRYRHWLADFVSTTPETLNAMKTLITAGDFEAAGKKVHAYKGRVGMLGMTDLHHVVTALDAAISEHIADPALFAETVRLSDQMCKELKQVLMPDSVPAAGPADRGES